MKRICFVFQHLQLSDGVARSAIGIANSLVSRGHDVTLRPLFRCEKEAIKYLDSRVHVEPFIGFCFHGLPRLIDIFVPKKILYHLVYNKKYDIEVGFQHGLSTKITGISPSDAKHFIWMHCYDSSLKKYMLKSDKVVSVSKDHAQKLAEEIEYAIPVDYCYNAIDEVSIIEEGKESCTLRRGQKPLFISVARMSEEKGFLRYLNVVKTLKEEGYFFECWLVGGGYQLNELKKTAEELCIEDIVTFVGPQANPHKFTSQGDLYVCCSTVEGYSTACTEAIILGVPVLTTAVGGSREIIETAEAGMVVDNSEKGIYEGLKKVLNHLEIIGEWKETISKTKDRFFKEKRVEQLVSVLEL